MHSGWLLPPAAQPACSACPGNSNPQCSNHVHVPRCESMHIPMEKGKACGPIPFICFPGFYHPYCLTQVCTQASHATGTSVPVYAALACCMYCAHSCRRAGVSRCSRPDTSATQAATSPLLHQAHMGIHLRRVQTASGTVHDIAAQLGRVHQ